MEKYDDLVFCRERTSQARSVYAPKNSVVIFSHTKSITYNYMDSWQGIWTHIPCQSLYSPEPPGEGEYTL